MKPHVTIDLLSDRDRILAELGYLAFDRIRRIRLPATVNVRIAWIHLPPTIAAALDMRPAPFSSAPNRYDGGWIEILGRSTHFCAIVQPDLHHVVVGHVVLGALDLLVDEATGTVFPRDPNGIICEV